MNALLSLDTLAQALSSAFPDVGAAAPLRVLGEGFGSTALETANGVIFRVARHARAGESYMREAQVLPLIKDSLPVAVPEPRWHLPTSPDFPFGIIGYRKLPGEPFNPGKLRGTQLRAAARQIGELVYALQRIPQGMLPLKTAQEEQFSEWQRWRAVTSPVLQGVLSALEYQKVQDWWEELLSDAQMQIYQPVFQHGDLWFGNLLVQNGRITGLLDFEAAGLGDPAQDFVPQLYLGQRFLDEVLDAFQKAGGAVDENFHHRLRHLWAVREFGGLAFAVEQDPAEFADAVEKIRRGPILSSRGLDGWGEL